MYDAVARWRDATPFVTTVTLAVDFPAPTVIEAGKVAPDCVEIVRGKACAVPTGAESTKLSLAELPPTTAVGTNPMLTNVGAKTVAVSFTVTDKYVALRVTADCELTPATVAVKGALKPPAGTTTDAGTLTTPGADETRLTVAPPAGALPERLTVIAAGVPLMNDV